jgi:hypothetical protein
MNKNDGCGRMLWSLAVWLMLLAISMRLGGILEELAKQTCLQTMAVCVTVPLPECKKEGVE